MTQKLARVLRKPVTGTLLSALVGFIIGAVVLAIAGYSPIEVYGTLFSSIFQKPKYFSQVVINAVPIIFTGLSVSFAARTGLFNIGAEGQYIAGSITAAMIGAFLPMPMVVHPIVILLLAFVAGGLVGALAGFLKNRYGVHEVISTIMINWILFNLNNLIVNLPSVKQEGTLRSAEVLDSAKILIADNWKSSDAGVAFLSNHPILRDIMRTDLNWGILLVIITAIVIAYFLKNTTTGFELRAVGLNKSAAEFAGIKIGKNTLLSMFISGGLAGLAGAIMVLSSTLTISNLAAQEGFGWDGITVALIAGYNPIGCMLSGLFFAALRYGGTAVQSTIGAPTEIINIMLGIIVFCVAMISILNTLADRAERRTVKKPAEGDAGAKPSIKSFQKGG